MDLNTMIGIGAGIITACGGIYSGFRRLSMNLKIKKEREHQAILDKAAEEMDRIKSNLEEKIQALEIDLATQKTSVDKDLQHMRENYMLEMHAVSEKINDLRDQLNQQHAQLVTLLTRMIEK